MVHLNLRSKITSGYLIVSVLILVVGYITADNLDIIDSRVQYLTNVIAREVRIGNALSSEVHALRGAIEKYIYRRFEKDLNEAQQHIATLEKSLQEMQNGMVSTGLQENVVRIEQLSKKYIDFFNTIVIRTKASKVNGDDLRSTGIGISKAITFHTVQSRDNSQRLSAIIKVLEKFNEARLQAASFLDTLDPAIVKQALTGLDAAIAILTEFEDEEFKQLRYDIEDYRDNFEGLADIELKLNNEISNDLLPLAPEIVDLVNTTTGAGWDQMGNAQHQVSSQVLASKKILFTTIFATLLLSVVLGYLLARVITRPLKNLVKVVGDIARGDVSGEIVTTVRDEIGELGRSMNAMIVLLRKRATLAEAIADGDLTREVEVLSSRDRVGIAMAAMVSNLTDIIGQIKDGADNLSVSASSLSGASASLSASSEESTTQAAGMADVSQVVSGQIGEVSSSSIRISEQMLSAAGSIEQMSAGVGEVGKAAEVSRSLSRQAADQAQNAVGVISELEQLAVEIDDVTQLINEFTEQTKLLALNATIEAAHAGAAGKGFTIVAEEIKELARQSFEAAGNIAQRISTIQQQAMNAVAAISTVSGTIKKVTLLSSEISSAVDEQNTVANYISSSVADTKENTNSISGYISELDARVRELADNISNLSQAAANSNQDVLLVNKSAEELSGMAMHLRELVGRFRLQQDTGNGESELQLEDSEEPPVPA